MKLYIANDSKQGLGGGWTFMRNLAKGLKQFPVEIVNTVEESDICLVCGATMITKDTFNKMRDLKKSIIVRLDNVPRNSRNRNTGTYRLHDFAQRADEVVWQCQWAKDYLIDFIGREGTIIYNGVDTSVFNKSGRDGNSGNIYIYSRYNRDETKMWEAAWYEFQLIARENPLAKLYLIGQFSPEQIEYKFDFFRGEKVEYLGVIDDPIAMAYWLKKADYLLATYYNDCYSNTYQEALACGVQLYKPNMSGGTPELLSNGIITLEQMAKNYYDLFREVLSR